MAQCEVLSLQVSLSALPGVDWARYSTSASSAANGGGWDLLSGDGLPFPVQQNGGTPSAPPLSLLNGNVGAGSGRQYLPAASAEALSRHALLPAPEQRRHSQPSQALQLAPRPLYPDFDATPARPIDYGFSRGGGSAAGEAPSAPPLDQQLSGVEVGHSPRHAARCTWLLSDAPVVCTRCGPPSGTCPLDTNTCLAHQDPKSIYRTTLPCTILRGSISILCGF